MKKAVAIPLIVLGAGLLTCGIYYYIFFIGDAKYKPVKFQIRANDSIVPVPEQDVPDFSGEDAGPLAGGQNYVPDNEDSGDSGDWLAGLEDQFGGLFSGD